MDLFGIENAVKAVVDTYFFASRRTGRTTNLLNSLKPGDRVYVEDMGMREWLMSRLKQSGIEGVECEVWNESKHPRLDGKAKGRVVFDHTLIEKRCKMAIQEEFEYISRLENELSSAPPGRSVTIEPQSGTTWLGRLR